MLRDATQLSRAAREQLIRTALGGGGTARVAMRGTSMLPLLHEPMMLELKACNGCPPFAEIVVFGTHDRLVAHRVVGRSSRAVICAGDAQPHRVELIDPDDILGVVAAVWSNAGVGAKRIDGIAFRLYGWLRAASRKTRSLLRLAIPWMRPRTFATLHAALSAVLRGDASVQRILQSAETFELAVVAQRHGCGALLHKATTDSQGPAAAVVSRLVQQSRWSASLRTAKLREQLIGVVKRLNTCGMEPLLLKGAARLWSFRAGAELHDSADLDLLVSETDLETARSALIDVGYSDEAYRRALWYYRQMHHHLAPLRAATGVPVELHWALARPGSLSLDTRAEALRGRAVRVAAFGANAFILDHVGSALHLAVHGFVRPKLRDLFLLAQELQEMSDWERSQLRAIVESERCEPIRLSATVATAARMAGIDWPHDARSRNFSEWMLQREDLPRPLRARPECVDAWLCAPRNPLEAALRAARRRSGIDRRRYRQLRPIARLLSAVVIAVYRPLMKKPQCGELLQDSIDVAGDDPTIDRTLGSEHFHDGDDVARSVAQP